MLTHQEKVPVVVKTFALLILSLTAIAYTYQYGRSVNQSYYRSFSVTGEGIITTTPDIARFSASVVTDGGMDAASVQRQNTEKMNQVIEFVKGQGIDVKDIKTQQYTLNPRYDYAPCVAGKICPSPKVSGYSVTQSVVVKVRTMDNIGALLSGVVENNANSVSDISFVTDDVNKATNDAREAAIAQGRKQAVLIARASGFSLGKLLSVYEDTGKSDPLPSAYGMGGDMQNKQSTPAPSIEPGSNEQTVSMVLTYEIR